MEENLAKFPKRVVKKIKTLHTFLSAANIKWSLIGVVEPNDEDIPDTWNVLDYSKFAVTGKGDPPQHFEKFVSIILRADVPLSIFCLKVQKIILKKKKALLKKKNAKEKAETDTN